MPTERNSIIESTLKIFQSWIGSFTAVRRKEQLRYLKIRLFFEYKYLLYKTKINREIFFQLKLRENSRLYDIQLLRKCINSILMRGKEKSTTNSNFEINSSNCNREIILHHILECRIKYISSLKQIKMCTIFVTTHSIYI